MMNIKPILAATAILLALTACGSKTCHVSGSSDYHQDGDTLYLYTSSESEDASDTLFVKGGKFDFTLELDSASVCFLRYRKDSIDEIQPFFLEPGEVVVELHKESGLSRISGTKMNDAFQVLNDTAYKYQLKITKLVEAMPEDATDDQKNELMSKVMSFTTILAGEVYKTAEKNIDNELGYLLVSNPEMLNEEQVLTLINKMPAKFRRRPAVKEIESYLRDSYKGVPQGGKISDFSAADPTGKKISASEVIGANELTIIDFWASWCGPCMNEMPHMVELYNMYHDKGLGILGVSLDTDGDAWKAAIKKTGALWPQISELNKNSEIARQFGVTAIPYTIVVARDGSILTTGLTGVELEDFVRNQLQ